jgi:hypothetical protein
MKEILKDLRTGALPWQEVIPFLLCMLQRLATGSYRNVNDEPIARQP